VKYLLLIFLALSPVAQAAKNILLVGYWPPTNEMLRDFKGGQKNWKNSGYDIYAYFPEFKKGETIGEGPFRVDFAATFNDFQKYTADLKPIAIIGFGKGAGPWEIETNFPAHYATWLRDGKLPSQVGVANGPVPASLAQNITRHGSLPESKIAEAVGALAWVDRNGDAGDYLCGFLGYLSAWYHDEHPDNVAAGFIHVNTDLKSAKAALDKTLDVLLEHLKSNTTK
jgi:pyrrolidone-carboxylate peptidase